MKINSLKIKMIMLEKGYNNGTLADKMGSTRQWLGAVLNRGHATMNYISKLAKALDVEPKEIIKPED
ncbi:helix-turn-helix domain-containing protein [Anaerococcus prevotii]|uniref:HTH cro/C1-type domain-containing protein n=1 Tax=Anaerococcus prevotii ACS-065-V-Col13 TaxID=879305 RepID=F0GU35_9FIRM|nr:helix-turn-helix transcriptional regulator [Anaerococcus prevotii]EGC82684.1 hypothetical protein HMPREF9290_1254 [Anaerococcus prevotii ACS-065-V-Col13]